MDEPKISVIVAVYQAEKYLTRCLDSILSQTFLDYEVILVDDGSKDHSGSICDEYVKKNSRFNVIHKNNEGVSIARQTGLDAAKGKYVIHADPDDWVEPDWLEALYNKIEEEKVDIVICDYERIFLNFKKHCVQCPTSYQNTDILQDLLVGKLWGVTWNKLVRRDCFIRFGVSFHPEMNLWEDLYVMCLLIAKGAKVSYLPRILYHYDSTINMNSIVMYRNDSHIHSCMVFIDTLSPVLSKEIFSYGWFTKKSDVKEMIFVTQSCNYSIKETYSEINERYIRETSRMSLGSRKRCVAISLRTNMFVGHLVYYLVNRLYPIVKILKHPFLFQGNVVI